MWLFQKQNPCSDVTKQQTKAFLHAQLQLIPKYLSWCRYCPTDHGNSNATLWHDSERKRNTRSRVKWQNALALWDAGAVQTNCELDRFKLLSFRHKQAQSFFIGQLRTPVPYPQAAGAVLAGVSVSPPQSAIACISKHDDKEGFKSRGWHYLILRPYASYSVTHISPTVKRTERSTTQSQAARRGGVGWLKTVDSRQCLTSQLNNKTSACFWLDEQQAAVSACGTGLELDG